MHNPKSLALQRIEILIEKVSKQREDTLVKGGQAPISQVDVWFLMMTSLQAVKVICSESSHHYYELSEMINEYKKTDTFNTDKWLGILLAISDDLQHGMLSNIRDLVAAEVFTDLIEMADYLLQQKYQIPAVSVSGAVLEDALRKICEKQNVNWPGESSISKLNTELYKAQIYDKVQHGQIEAWGKLRNKVDHGQFSETDEINLNDADRMVNGIKDFVAKYLV